MGGELRSSIELKINISFNSQKIKDQSTLFQFRYLFYFLSFPYISPRLFSSLSTPPNINLQFLASKKRAGEKKMIKKVERFKGYFRVLMFLTVLCCITVEYIEEKRREEQNKDGFQTNFSSE